MYFEDDKDRILKKFDSIDLQSLKELELFDRTDKKFIINIDDLHLILIQLLESHKVLRINENHIQSYRTIYYDTSDLKMYLAHHNKKTNRFKIRTREYLDSNLCFLEIKNKSNKGKTVKKRIKLKESRLIDNPKNQQFISINSPFVQSNLSAVLGNVFRRIMLVDNALTERLTIDIDLQAWEVNNRDNSVDLKDIAIIELKRDANSIADTHKKLIDLRIKSMGFSKYAIASSILFADKLKNNNFKQKQRWLAKILEK